MPESPSSRNVVDVPVTAHDTAVAGMFGRIVRWYDVLNHVLSLGMDVYWRRVLAETARPGEAAVILDLAAGTLDVSLALRRRSPAVVILAMDFCLPMLRQGGLKLARKDIRGILPVGADAKRLPVAAASVDSITMAFGIRNILPRASAFAEMLRVLKPGGRACILEFGSGQERIWGGLYNLYLNHMLPRLGRFVSQDGGAYNYLADSIRAFPSAVRLEEELREVGFAHVWHKKLTSGIVCLHVGEKARLSSAG